MITFLIRRFLQAVITMLIVTTLAYTVLVLMMPTGPGAQYTELQTRITQLKQRGESASYIQELSTILDRFTQVYKLDRPWPLNYLAWLFDPNDTVQFDENYNEVSKGLDITLGEWRIRGAGVLTGEFGKSDIIAEGRPVSEVISTRWMNSVVLVGVSFLLSVLIALPIGVIAAVRQGSTLDRALTFFSFAGISLPSFWLGLMLIVFLAVLPKQWSTQPGWEWMPYLPPGNVAETGREDDLVNRLYHLALPALTLSLIQVAAISRFIRAAMLEVLRKDFVRTAWAKGLPQRDVIFKHALRNALTPLITIFGLTLPSLISGAVVVETVFGYSGMGQLFYRALGGYRGFNATASVLGAPIDIAVALVLFLTMTVVVILSNLITDMAYAVSDPRVNYSRLQA